MRFMLYKVLLVTGLAAALCAAQAPRAQATSAAQSPTFLGVWVWQIDHARAKQLHLPDTMGVEVTLVRKDSPAEHAGLRPGDVITKYGDTRVEGIDQFSEMVRDTPAGQKVTLEVYRGGTPQMITAKIASSAGLEPVPGIIVPPPGVIPDLPRSMTTWRSPVLGVDAEALEGQLAGYFGVKEGVLVRSVIAGSAAEKAGLKAGDVILSVDGHEVATPTDVTARLRELTGNSVKVALMRDHREVEVTVTLEDDRAHCCQRSAGRERLE